MIKVYFEDERHISAELVAVFVDENTFDRCHSKLAALAKEARCVVTTSIEEADLSDTEDFIGAVYEIAFGEDAINKGYTGNEVLSQIQGFSDKAQELDDLNAEEFYEEDDEEQGVTDIHMYNNQPKTIGELIRRKIEGKEAAELNGEG